MWDSDDGGAHEDMELNFNNLIILALYDYFHLKT